MRILIAPDSFKHSLSAKEVAENLSKGIRRAIPSAMIQSAPMADGGEGTVQVLVDATNGQIIRCNVFDPLFRLIPSYFGVLGDGKTAVIEMAAASGLALLSPNEYNPMRASTFGTGQLMKRALELGYERMIIGLGGSATIDGGAGMAAALGARFLNKYGQPVEYGGGSIGQIETIDFSGLDAKISDCDIIAAADVTNPLTGNLGAACVFGEQKGAISDEINTLEKNLTHLARITKTFTGFEVESIPGSGAAGGLGAGLAAFLNAKIFPGFQVISSETGLEKKVSQADVVITGEGKMDNQTKFGKTPMGVALLAKRFNKPVFAFTGILGSGYEELLDIGFDEIFPINSGEITVETSISNAPVLLEEAAYRMALKYLRP